MRKLEILLASSNKGKLRELRAMAGNDNVLAGLFPGFAQLPPASEHHESFALNAMGKALHYSRLANGLVVADDSGLAVDALDGSPGVRSARYAGPEATDEENNRKLIDELRHVPAERRTARYICVLALAHRGKVLALFSDKCEGQIILEPQGTGGFGYDPYFFFPPLGKTLAQASESEKNQVSHRGKAFRKLIVYLAENTLPRGTLR